MTKFVVGTTLCAFAMDQHDTWSAWLRGAADMRDQAHWRGDEIEWFAALQVDARGVKPFEPLIAELVALGGVHWQYSLDDGRTEVTTANRLRHIVCGQNLANDYCQAAGADHLLFLAADCSVPADAPWKLKEAGDVLGAHVVGAEVPTYCLSGPSAWVGEQAFDPPFPCEAHMPTAAAVMLSREAFRLLRWRWDLDESMSDDPCLYADALARGFRVVVRKDCIGRHMPESIPRIEERGHDMRVVR